MQQAQVGQHQQALFKTQIWAQIGLEFRYNTLPRLQSLFNKREH